MNQTIKVDLNLEELTRFLENFNHTRAEIVAIVPLAFETKTRHSEFRVTEYRIFTRTVR